MKIKTKRIITSLALAASLAIAPMNVSADVSGTQQITQGDVVEGVANKQTIVRVSHRVGVKYVVEVPEVLEFNLTNPDKVDLTADPKVLPIYSDEKLPMYLRRASGFLRNVPKGGSSTATYDQQLKITPTFKGNQDLGILDADVVISGGAGDKNNEFTLNPPYQEQQPFDYSKTADCKVDTSANSTASERVYKAVDANDPNSAVTIGHIQYDIEVANVDNPQNS